MNKVSKILVVAAIVIGIVAVWFLKNKPIMVDEEGSKWNEVINIEEDLMSIEKEKQLAEDTETISNEVIKEEDAEVVTTQEKSKKEDVSVNGVEEPKKETSVKKTEKDETTPAGSEEVPGLVGLPVETVVQESQSDEIIAEDVVSQITTPDLVATEFDLEKLKEYKLPIMIEFGASWCTWCRWMEPTLEELNKEYAGKVVIQSVDVERFYNEVNDFDVSLLPTIYFFDAEGNVFETRVGAMTREDILSVFERMGVKND